MDTWHDQLLALAKRWPKLSQRTRDGILVLGGVKAVHPQSPAQAQRTRRGDTPDWLIVALNLLKDSNGYLSDREVARRLGISHSTLCRTPAYRHARRTYLQATVKVVRGRVAKNKSK